MGQSFISTNVLGVWFVLKAAVLLHVHAQDTKTSSFAPTSAINPTLVECHSDMNLALWNFITRCARHTSHVTRRTSQVTRHTSHVTRRTSHVTRHTSHVTRHTSHVTRRTSHVACHTAHVSRHTSQGGLSFRQCGNEGDWRRS